MVAFIGHSLVWDAKASCEWLVYMLRVRPTMLLYNHALGECKLQLSKAESTDVLGVPAECDADAAEAVEGPPFAAKMSVFVL